MFVDAGTKAMDCSHLKKVICNGSWSIECNTEFVRQKVKSRKTTSTPSTPEDGEAPGELLTDANRELRQFVENFGFKPGWHLVGQAPKQVCVQVAKGAKSYRSPEPRKSSKDFPYRTTVGKFLLDSNRSEWRVLERDEGVRTLEKPYSKLPRVPELLGRIPSVQATKILNPCECMVCLSLGHPCDPWTVAQRALELFGSRC